jgi:hypothetical protein
VPGRNGDCGVERSRCYRHLRIRHVFCLRWRQISPDVKRKFRWVYEQEAILGYLHVAAGHRPPAWKLATNSVVSPSSGCKAATYTSALTFGSPSATVMTVPP